MELVHQQLNLKDILTELIGEIAKVRRKTNALIEYYIYPERTPSAISAYEPRIGILESRTKSLSKISFPFLSQILDHADATGASYANDIIDQLLNAIHGLHEVFKDHYDRSLQERKPYLAMYRLLEFRENQLKEFTARAMTNPNPARPENMRTSDPSYFCRGAIQMLNKRDNGRIAPVKERELSEANVAVIRRFGGGYLWWECTDCKYRVRFHMVNSNNSSIHGVEEVREHSTLAIEYRSAFLAKCHLFAPAADEEKNRRRKSSVSWTNAGSDDRPRYGCVFCFGEGKTLERDRTTFYSAKELAEHLVSKHKDPYPHSLMLLKFCVAIKGKCAENVRRWDINFR